MASHQRSLRGSRCGEGGREHPAFRPTPPARCSRRPKALGTASASARACTPNQEPRRYSTAPKPHSTASGPTALPLAPQHCPCPKP